jgi:hypothetical protein
MTRGMLGMITNATVLAMHFSDAGRSFKYVTNKMGCKIDMGAYRGRKIHVISASAARFERCINTNRGFSYPPKHTIFKYCYASPSPPPGLC